MPDYGTARADFPGGDAGLLYRSIRRILELPADTRLFTCHDYKAAGRDRTLLWVARSKFYYRPRPESAEKTRVAMAALSGGEDTGGASEYWQLHRRRLPFTDASRRV